MGYGPFSFLRSSIGSLYETLKRLVRSWTKPGTHTLVLNVASDLTPSKPELVLENVLLRQQWRAAEGTDIPPRPDG